MKLILLPELFLVGIEYVLFIISLFLVAVPTGGDQIGKCQGKPWELGLGTVVINLVLPVIFSLAGPDCGGKTSIAIGADLHTRHLYQLGKQVLAAKAVIVKNLRQK